MFCLSKPGSRRSSDSSAHFTYLPRLMTMTTVTNVRAAFLAKPSPQAAVYPPGQQQQHSMLAVQEEKWQLYKSFDRWNTSFPYTIFFWQKKNTWKTTQPGPTVIVACPAIGVVAPSVVAPPRWVSFTWDRDQMINFTGGLRLLFMLFLGFLSQCPSYSGHF